MEYITKLLNLNVGSYSMENIFSAVIAFIICYVATKIIMSIISKMIKKSNLDPTITRFALPAIRVVLYFITLLIVADSLKIPVASLLAVFSVAGLAISLSVQDALSNLANGILMIVAKPFAVGDYIDAGNISGTVKAVGLIYTTMATVDNKIIYVPNSDISAGKIVNYSKEELRRVDLKFTASYDSPVETVKASIAKAVERTGLFINDPEVFINVFAYNDSNIEYVVRAWIKNADYWKGYYDLLENVKKAFDEDGVEMTYNHINVHMINK